MSPLSMAIVSASRLFLVVLLVRLAADGPAWGHAVLLETEPADRSVAAAPAAVELRFGEPVTPVSVRVLDAAGRIVAGPDDAVAVGGIVRQTLPGALADGLYLVSYRVVSADSHPVSGSIQFAVGHRSAAWSDGEADSPEFWTGPIGAVRALHLAALAIAAGGALFLLLVQPAMAAAERARLRRMSAVGAVTAAASAVLAIGLQGALLAEAAPADFFAPVLWHLGVATTRGTVAIAATAASLVILAGLFVTNRTIASSLLAGGAAAAVSGFALSGHAVTAGPLWITLPAVLLHAGIALFWLGSFLPLADGLRAGPDAAVEPLARFSTIALGAVPVLVLAGLVLAVLQVERPEALVETRYGWLLMAKLALVAGLFGLAAYNRLRLLPALRAGRHHTVRRFRRSIALELAVGMGVLALTAFLSQMPPPRSMSPAESPGSHVVAVTDGRRLAVVDVVPALGGRDSRVTVHLAGDDGSPLDAQEAVLAVANPAAGIEPLTRSLDRRGPGLYHHTGPLFSLPGRWTVRIEVLIDDFHKTSFRTQMTVE